MGFFGDVGAIFSHFGVLQGLEFLPNAEPDVATMLWQIVQLFTFGGQAACCCLVAFRVFNRDLKDLRTAWRIQFLLFTIGRFFGMIESTLAFPVEYYLKVILLVAFSSGSRCRRCSAG